MKVKYYLQDFGKSIVIGFILSGIMALFSGIFSAFAVHGHFIGILYAMRSTLCVVGALGLFLSAAMLLTKNTSVSDTYGKEWRQHFKKLNIVGVILIISVILLLFAGGIDCIRLYYD